MPLPHNHLLSFLSDARYRPGHQRSELYGVDVEEESKGKTVIGFDRRYSEVVREVGEASMRKTGLKVWNPRVGNTQQVITHGVGRACRIAGLLMRNG